MSKSLRSIPQEKRQEAIRRRLEQKIKGLGYWAAVDAIKKQKMVVSKSA